MPRIVTGALNYTAVVRNLNKGTYEYGSRAYFGTSLTGASTAYNEIFALFFSPIPGELQEAGAGEITKLRIKLTLKKKTTADTESEIAYKIFSARQTWGSPSALYNIIDGGDSYAFSWVDYPNTLEASEITITLTGTEAYYAAQYGISVANPSSADVVEVTSYSMEADVSDEKVPPVIALQNGMGQVLDGKYWHYPWNEFTISVSYTQETDSPLDHVELEYTADGITRLFSGAYGSPDVTVPLYAWGDLPESGTLKIRAYSEAGTVSNIIEMPFEVAAYTVSFTSHTAGSIVRSDSDVVITWEATTAGLPSGLIMSQEPTKYIRYIWWDNEEPTHGTHMTGTTYTIPAETLSAHSVLHIAVSEGYGDYGQRDLKNASVLNLYIQQMAVVDFVTVSPKRFVNPDLYYPIITVSWDASGQVAYRLQVGDVYDTGAVFGAASSHDVAMVLDNGTYPVQLKIQDTYGRWTDWTDPVWVHVEASIGRFNSISASYTDDGAVITVTLDDPSLFSDILIYRNGVLIKQVPTGGNDVIAYTDRYAGGHTLYTARCITADGLTYKQTKSVSVDAYPDGDVLFTEHGAIRFRFVREYPEYTVVPSEEVHMVHYSGRSEPVAIRSGKRSRVMNLMYVTDDLELADKLEAAAGTVCTLVNRLGMVFHGLVSGMSVRRWHSGCAAAFTMTQVWQDASVPYVRG